MKISDKIKSISTEESTKCLCDEPLCAKCLLSNCKDPECKIHTKELKERAIAFRGNNMGKGTQILANTLKPLILETNDVLVDFVMTQNMLFVGENYKSVEYNYYIKFGNTHYKHLKRVGLNLVEISDNIKDDQDGLISMFADYLLALQRAINAFTTIMIDLDSKPETTGIRFSWLKVSPAYFRYKALLKKYGEKGKIMQDYLTDNGFVPVGLANILPTRKEQTILSAESYACNINASGHPDCSVTDCIDPHCRNHDGKKKLIVLKKSLVDTKKRMQELTDSSFGFYDIIDLNNRVHAIKYNIEILEGTAELLQIDYKPGYGPNGSVWKRIYYRTTAILFVLMCIAIPLLIFWGIYYLFTLIF